MTDRFYNRLHKERDELEDALGNSDLVGKGTGKAFAKAFARYVEKSPVANLSGVVNFQEKRQLSDLLTEFFVEWFSARYEPVRQAAFKAGERRAR